MRRIIVAVLFMVFCGTCAVAQQSQPLTKEQIVERVQAIDRQLLQIEKQELIKQYQAIEAKEKAAKPATPKKEEKK